MNPSDFLIYFVHLQMTQDFSPLQRLRGHKLLRRASSELASLPPLRNRAAAILSLRQSSNLSRRLACGLAFFLFSAKLANFLAVFGTFFWLFSADSCKNPIGRFYTPKNVPKVTFFTHFCHGFWLFLSSSRKKPISACEGRCESNATGITKAVFC